MGPDIETAKASKRSEGYIRNPKLRLLDQASEVMHQDWGELGPAEGAERRERLFHPEPAILILALAARLVSTL